VTVADYNAAFDPANDAFRFAFHDGFKEGWIFATVGNPKRGVDTMDYMDASEAFSSIVDMANYEAYLAHRQPYFAFLPLAAIPEVGKEIQSFGIDEATRRRLAITLFRAHRIATNLQGENPRDLSRVNWTDQYDDDIGSRAHGAAAKSLWEGMAEAALLGMSDIQVRAPEFDIAEMLREIIAAGVQPEKWDNIQLKAGEFLERITTPTPPRRLIEAPKISVMPMALSNGTTDYFVMASIGDRALSIHVFREEYKAAYHVALYDWLFNGTEKPDLMDFDEGDWPAQPVTVPPVQPATVKQLQWSEFVPGMVWGAESIVGRFLVSKCADDAFNWKKDGSIGNNVSFVSVEEAKIAAQISFEQTIRSAFV
jgi:hypothetical protein